MNKNKAIGTTIVIVVAVAAVAWTVKKGTDASLRLLYPDIDPKIVRKANTEMVKDSLAGKYNDVDTDDDDIMRAIFLDKVQKLTASK